MTPSDPNANAGQSSNSSSPVQPVTAAVAVKPPVFDETSVTRWFTIVESQFVLAKITVPSTKFHHILATLPLRVMNQLSDDVITSMDYDRLKQALITLFTRSKPELFDSLLDQHNIMCDKPSTYLRDLRRIAAQLGVDDAFLRLKFLKALPNNIRPLLVTYDESTSLEELARVADTLLAYGTHVNVASSASVSLVAGRSSDLRTDLSQGDNRGSNFRDNIYGKPSVPIGVRTFHDSQRPQVCRYHLYYGNKAKSCKKWCMLSSTSTNVLPDSRPPSRSSSPAPMPHQSGN